MAVINHPYLDAESSYPAENTPLLRQNSSSFKTSGLQRAQQNSRASRSSRKAVLIWYTCAQDNVWSILNTNLAQGTVWESKYLNFDKYWSPDSLNSVTIPRVRTVPPHVPCPGALQQAPHRPLHHRQEGAGAGHRAQPRLLQVPHRGPGLLHYIPGYLSDTKNHTLLYPYLMLQLGFFYNFCGGNKWKDTGSRTSSSVCCKVNRYLCYLQIYG